MGGTIAVVVVVTAVASLLIAAAAGGGGDDGGDFGGAFEGAAGGGIGGAIGGGTGGGTGGTGGGGEAPPVPGNEAPSLPSTPEAPTLPATPQQPPTGIVTPGEPLIIGIIGGVPGSDGPSTGVAVDISPTPMSGRWVTVGGTNGSSPSLTARKALGAKGSSGALRLEAMALISEAPENAHFLRAAGSGVPSAYRLDELFWKAYFPNWADPALIKTAADTAKKGGSYGTIFIPASVGAL